MPRYFLQLSYNGSAYHGWQIQENTQYTIQHFINKTLSLILNETVFVTGCGRTDTGVHASVFFAHFNCSKDISIDSNIWVNKFNRVLPSDIAIQAILPVRDDAHARFDATSRTYHYYICKTKNPFKINMCYFLPGSYNLEKMNLAAAELFNYTDFSAFSKSNTQTVTNNCKIYEAHWYIKNDNMVFVIKADRFLRNMVRSIVGTLLDVGKEKLSITEFKYIIESKKRCNAGMSVSAGGLYLTKVDYPKNYFNTVL